jgi:hypothetical protein
MKGYPTDHRSILVLADNSLKCFDIQETRDVNGLRIYFVTLGIKTLACTSNKNDESEVADDCIIREDGLLWGCWPSYFFKT